MSTSEDRSRMDELIDLLADMVAERMRAPGAEVAARGRSRAAVAADSGSAPAAVAPSGAPRLPTTVEACPAEEEFGASVEGDVQEEPATEPPPLGPPHAARLMSRLAMALLLIIMLINIPINCHGTTLATAMPDAQSLVIRDGLVVKVEEDPEIYVYRDGAFHWISSMDAFEHYGYTWADVRVVNAQFLRGFEIGEPIHVLLKCNDSPHVYRLENGAKRWIVDIPTFVAESYVWERDIKRTTCEALRSLPDGETIPPGRGPAPQP